MSTTNRGYVVPQPWRLTVTQVAAQHGTCEEVIRRLLSDPELRAKHFPHAEPVSGGRGIRVHWRIPPCCAEGHREYDTSGSRSDQPRLQAISGGKS